MELKVTLNVEDFIHTYELQSGKMYFLKLHSKRLTLDQGAKLVKELRDRNIACVAVTVDNMDSVSIEPSKQVL